MKTLLYYFFTIVFSLTAALLATDFYWSFWCYDGWPRLFNWLNLLIAPLSGEGEGVTTYGMVVDEFFLGFALCFFLIMTAWRYLIKRRKERSGFWPYAVMLSVILGNFAAQYYWDGWMNDGWPRPEGFLHHFYGVKDGEGAYIMLENELRMIAVPALFILFVLSRMLLNLGYILCWLSRGIFHRITGKNKQESTDDTLDTITEQRDA